MDIKEANSSLDSTVAALLKPTTAITQTVSNKYLKVARLTEYCKVAEEQLRECQTKLQMLTSSRNESEKLKAEYLNRNKINSTNTDSLVQVKNELYKYKCELKSNYITTQRVVHSRRQKYQKLISSYESEWQRTLEQYNNNPIVLELVQIQEENISLEKEIEKLEKLKNVTEAEFVEVTQKVKQNFLNEIVEFSKAMVEYHKALKKKKKDEILAIQDKSSAFNFGRTEVPVLNIKDIVNVEDDGEQMGLSCIDVSVFDEVSVPVESLEAQNEEELLPFFENDSKMEENPEDRYQNEAMEIDQKDVQEREECKNIQQQSKTAVVGESQYFRSQQQTENMEPEPWLHSQGVFVKSGNKEFDENQQSGKLKGNGNEDEFPREMQTAKETFRMENEESLSDGSFENQYGFQNKPLESKQMAPREYNEIEPYTKTSSMSSDDMLHHGNETVGSPGHGDKQIGNFLSKPDQDKEFKSFGGFFSLGNETNSPKPSIFKLF